MPEPSSSRCRRRTARSSSTKVGARAASPRRSARRSWRARSTRSMRRLRGCAARRCPCPTRSISRMRRSPSPRRSSPRCARSFRPAMASFLLPKLGADMTEGRLVEWLKRPGERIERGEVIAVVETDKANVEVESWVAGTMEKILVEPGDKWMPVGTPLAAIRTDGVEPVARPAFAQAPPPSPVPPAPPAAAPSGAALPGERLRASPTARGRAEALGLDLASIRATGPDGRITLEDVEHAASAKPAARPPADRQQRMREAIATAMSRAKREIPHYYLSTVIDCAPALEWLEARNRDRPVTERLLHGVLLLKAVALALREVPELNGFWIDGRAGKSGGGNVGG